MTYVKINDIKYEATVKRGKTTELEEAYELLYGGLDNE